MVRIKSVAKLNLMLNIVGKTNNMHLIDGVFVPFNLYDIIYAEKRSDHNISVSYTDKNLKFDNDTAIKAAQAIVSYYDIGGVDIFIEKNIPQKSGMGGSSADAAGVARAIQELYGLPKIDNELLVKIGSDVPYMYKGGDCRVRGIGEKVESITLPKLYKVVLLPNEGVDTAQCYNLYDQIGGENGDIEKFIDKPFSKEVKPSNALKNAACKLNKDISSALDALSEAGFLCGMSGSGSACFGIEYDIAEFERKSAKLKKLSTGRFVALQEEKE
ncbi:hypothetical protein EOM82_07840 [bacterium]|nr:hypothetical protein [bacterium]